MKNLKFDSSVWKEPVRNFFIQYFLFTYFLKNSVETAFKISLLTLVIGLLLYFVGVNFKIGGWK